MINAEGYTISAQCDALGCGRQIEVFGDSQSRAYGELGLRGWILTRQRRVYCSPLCMQAEVLEKHRPSSGGA